MPIAPNLTVVFVPVWVVLKVQNGGERSGKDGMPQSSGGNKAIGVLLVFLAAVVWQTSNIVAFGVGLLGVYLVLGGKL